MQQDKTWTGIFLGLIWGQISALSQLKNEQKLWPLLLYLALAVFLLHDLDQLLKLYNGDFCWCIAFAHFANSVGNFSVFSEISIAHIFHTHYQEQLVSNISYR